MSERHSGCASVDRGGQAMLLDNDDNDDDDDDNVNFIVFREVCNSLCLIVLLDWLIFSFKLECAATSRCKSCSISASDTSLHPPTSSPSPSATSPSPCYLSEAPSSSWWCCLCCTLARFSGWLSRWWCCWRRMSPHQSWFPQLVSPPLMLCWTSSS